MSSGKELRREIAQSGSPLVNHSMNQGRLRHSRDEEGRYFGNKSKKVIRAEARRKLNENPEDTSVPLEGKIVFAEDLELNR